MKITIKTQQTTVEFDGHLDPNNTYYISKIIDVLDALAKQAIQIEQEVWKAQASLKATAADHHLTPMPEPNSPEQST